MNDSQVVSEPDPNDAVIDRAVKKSLVVLVGLVILVGIGYAIAKVDWSGDEDAEVSVDLPTVREVKTAKIPQVPFTDITRAAGIDFRHENGARGEKMLPETMGGGCAFWDFDSDGDQDILFVNSTEWPWNEGPRNEGPRNEENRSNPTLGVYANDGDGTFRDVTHDVGLAHTLYGMGCATGDYDNDGDVDLFVTAVGRNELFQNEGGVFRNVTAQAGVAGDADAWSTSAAWLDYDRDGDLDLFICNYVKWSRELDLEQDFRLTGIGRAYGPPTSFPGSSPYLYRNNGDGTFADVSSTAGVQPTNPSTGDSVGKSLGIAPIDIDRDGWIDLVVANDTVRNFVFRNLGDGRYEEVGVLAGVAFDAGGKARGAMGIDTACFRSDTPDLGIAIANFANEMTALYVSSGHGILFTDDAIPTGLGPPTRSELSFGLFFFDYDLDGRLDLATANGHLESEINRVQQSQHYRQPARLFWNAGANQATEFVAATSAHCGEDFFQPIVGRGAAYADIDSDGDLDVLLTQVGGAPLLLRNDQALGHAFVRFRLRGTESNADAIGAWIEVHSGGHVLRRQVMPSRSYLSQVELPVTIGLGQHGLDRVSIRWPSGQDQVVPLADVVMNGTTVIREAPRVPKTPDDR